MSDPNNICPGYKDGDHYYPEDCCEALGISADQLKIARALDREKVKWIRERANPEYVCESQEKSERFFFHLLDWLPTFEDEKNET